MSTRLHGFTSQKTIIFMITVMRTSDVEYIYIYIYIYVRLVFETFFGMIST
jgi:hypothetical protein